jgi:hypothetical protein
MKKSKDIWEKNIPMPENNNAKPKVRDYLAYSRNSKRAA